MKYQTIFLDNVRQPKVCDPPEWVAKLRSGRIIARDADLDQCKCKARSYVEGVLRLPFGQFMRYA